MWPIFIMGEKERERKRIMLCTIRWELHYVFQHNHVYKYTIWKTVFIFYVAYVYTGEIVSLIENQRVGIFQPKSKILFYLSLALI